MSGGRRTKPHGITSKAWQEMRAFEASKARIEHKRWPTVYVTPACRCAAHEYAHVHPPFERWPGPVKE